MKNTLPLLRNTYRSFTDSIKRVPQRTTPINPAFTDDINRGVFRDNIRLPTDINMHVDDNLMVDTASHMMDSILASISSNFKVLGPPEPHIRKVSLADKKFRGTALSSLRPQLGLLIDTRRMTISINLEKRSKIIDLLSQFGPHRKLFQLNFLTELTDTLNLSLIHISEPTRPY